jgi:hypothetical protein
MKQVLSSQGFSSRFIVSCCELIVIKSDCKRSVNKSNHPIQNPLLLVTEPQTRDSMLAIKIEFVKHNEVYE